MSTEQIHIHPLISFSEALVPRLQAMSFLYHLTSLDIREDIDVVDDVPYHYIPTRYITILLLVLFSISTLGHTVQSIAYRMWWLLPTACLCGFLEILGWSGRLWSTFSPTNGNPFLMQITTTILGPTPLLAANFVIFGLLIKRLGPAYSRLTPKWYTIVFCTCDVVSLLVQGTGGGIASSADDDAGSTLGGNIMLGGIIFQLVTITIYVLCASEFFIRYLTDRPIRQNTTTDSYGKSVTIKGQMNTRLKVMSMALAFTTTCLFIRSIYRTIELTDGWNGRIISTQVYFNVLDGAMVVLAIYTLNFAHPGFLLRDSPPLDETYKSGKLGVVGSEGSFA